MNNKKLSIIVYICIVLTTTVAAFPDNAYDGNGGGSNELDRASFPVSLMKQNSFRVSSLSEPSVVSISEQWNKTFGGIGYDWANSVLETSDGGYLFTGGTTSFGNGDSNVWLVKTDASGSMQWNRSFGGWGFDKAYSLQMTTDNGYIIAGITNSSGNGGFDALLIKTDANGNEQWSKTFGGTNDDAVFSVLQTSDFGYVIVGESWSYRAGFVDAWLIKTNANGDLQWSKTFGGTGYSGATSVRQTLDGGYILAAWTVPSEFGTSDALLIKTDANGNKQWSKTFGGTSEDWIESVKQTSDSGYIIAGVFNSSTYYDFWLIKTDEGGNQQWDKKFGGSYDDVAYDVNQTSDGYILIGGTMSYGAGDVDVYLVKTDKDGIQQWNQTFGGTDYDNAFSVRQTLDGGFILAGETWSYAAGYNDAWLIKVLTPPSSLSVEINNGADFTNSTAVTLSISAVGATNMSFSNDTVNWSAWEPFESQKQWALPGGDGVKTVYFKASNSVGEAAPVRDTIILDMEPPTPTNYGIYRYGVFYLDTNWDNYAEIVKPFGISTDVPVTGDWDGNNRTNYGIYRNGAFYLDTNQDNYAEIVYTIGIIGDIPVTGDWDGDGRTNYGIYRNGVFFLDTNWDNYGDIVYTIGIAGDVPVTGDWDGDGLTNYGVYRNGVFFLDTNFDNYGDLVYTIGIAGDVPVTGDWDGDGRTNYGIYRNGVFYLDTNWDNYGDQVYAIGIPGDIPVTGKW